MSEYYYMLCENSCFHFDYLPDKVEDIGEAIRLAERYISSDSSIEEIYIDKFSSVDDECIEEGCEVVENPEVIEARKREELEAIEALM